MRRFSILPSIAVYWLECSFALGITIEDPSPCKFTLLPPLFRGIGVILRVTMLLVSVML